MTEGIDVSRITELAEQEADEAEAEDEEETEPESQELESQESPAGPSDAQLKKFEAENQRHAQRLAEIMGGDFAMFVECDDCGGVGFRPPSPPLELRVHPDTLECPDCDGLGERITGSRVAQHVTKQCEKCQGNGFVHKSALAVAQPAAPQSGSPANGISAEQIEAAKLLLSTSGHTVVPPFVPPPA